MTRPLRIEFSGALYHVTSRGNAREDIYLQDGDRLLFLEILGAVCNRYNWTVHAYCLMSNHYHLLIETPDSNLSQGMRQLNGVYTQQFNRSHKRVGHIFQGRYKAILVQKETYLLELARYIVLNPVRARMVHTAKEWPWSSYLSTAGITPAPTWLSVDWLLSVFSEQRTAATTKYTAFVTQGLNQPAPWERLKNQIYLGDKAFVDKMQCKMTLEQKLDDIPKIQKRQVAKPISYYAENCLNRDESITKAYQSGAYSLKQIGDYFGLHYSRVSRIVKQTEAKDRT